MPSSDTPILVTGATGFTGGHLARTLVQRGHRVRALVRQPDKAQHLAPMGIDLVAGDITDAASVHRAAEGVAMIYHIAAVFRTAGHPQSYYHQVNVIGTKNVLDAARAHGVQRTLHCSTVGVHGNVSQFPSDESAPYNPGDIYQLTKLEGERLAQRAIADGQPVVIFRPAGIYGPGDIRFLKLFRAIHKRRFCMFGSGEILYHFTYIDDLVEGIMLCGEHPAALGNIYILGGNDYITLNEMTRIIAATLRVPPPRLHIPLWPLRAAAWMCESICTPLGIDPPLHKRRVEFFAKNRAFSSEKAKRELGYQPQIDFTEGVRRTAAWYFEQGHLHDRASQTTRT